MLQWFVKGNSAANAILWVLTLLIGIICFLWMFQTVDPTNVQTVDLIYKDLEILQLKLSTACEVYTYDSDFNPMLPYGNLTFDRAEVCITADEMTACSPLVCNTLLDENIEIAGITTIHIKKDTLGVYSIT